MACTFCLLRRYCNFYLGKFVNLIAQCSQFNVSPSLGAEILDRITRVISVSSQQNFTLHPLPELPMHCHESRAHWMMSCLRQDYCGVLSEESIRKNFVLIYELLDEIMVWAPTCINFMDVMFSVLQISSVDGFVCFASFVHGMACSGHAFVLCRPVPRLVALHRCCC